MAGKPVVMRLPQELELDIGSRVDEEVRTAAPAPEGWPRRPKGALILA